MAVHHKGITIKFTILLMLLLVGFASGEIVRCIGRERRALLRFKQGLTDEYGSLSSWGSQDHKKECCKWDGVWCNNNTGHVAGLRLLGRPGDDRFYTFGGKIDSALLELHHLNYLDLSDNNFGGIEIPEFLGSIKELVYLNLRHSNFSGIIPPQLGNLSNLRALDLSYNPIHSENLDWLSHLSLLSLLDLTFSYIRDANWLQQVLKLPSLQELHLRSCKLSDVASSVDSFVNSSSTSLFIIDLFDNKLTSSAFNWLFNISKNLVDIRLPYNQLDGPIPDTFGELIFLKSLDLSMNMIEGGIPKSLCNLSHLQALYLNHNDLGEPLEELFGNISVPASLGQLSKLKYLDLSYNSLEGTISEGYFKKLYNLKGLGLSFNSLTFDLSTDWIPPFHLEIIDLAGCKMGPSFPTWLHTRRNFTYLDLSCNGISDEAPKWLWNLSSSVRYLNLSHNQFSGTFHDLPSNLIEGIDVSSNNFSGPVPLFHPNILVVLFSQNKFSGPVSSICAISPRKLRLLDLSNNQLSGQLPNCWENTIELQMLNLNNNSLFGDVPHGLGALRNLKSLHLWGNKLSGQLPSTLKNCQSLQVIDIGGNKLTGKIPSWLGKNYTNMVYLSFRQNRFYGGIPPEICNFTRLQVLDLSGNNISGKIPECFSNFISLVDNRTITSTVPIPRPPVYIEHGLVQWKGQECEWRNTLRLLKLIDLSSNRLIGSIPRSFSSLKGLGSLNLSRNNLTGNIIPDIGQMEMLEILDLSRNQLSGEIPVGLAQLHFLDVLDLSNNNLSGEIPTSTQLQSFNASVYAGNSHLCGRPLELCVEDGLKPSNSDEGENINETEDGFLNLSFMQEFGISMAFGFIVGFWGVVGSLLLKKSWRSAYFNFSDAVGDWLYVTTAIFFNKFRQN